jgi:nicotinamidase-related amidase
VQNDGSPGDPDALHTLGWELVFPVIAGELVVRKRKSDAFTNEIVGAPLDSRKVDRVVVAGMQSNYCVSATCRGALHRGLEVVLASGAMQLTTKKKALPLFLGKLRRSSARKGSRSCRRRELDSVRSQM